MPATIGEIHRVNVQTATKTFHLPVLLSAIVLMGAVLASCGGSHGGSAGANAGAAAGASTDATAGASPGATADASPAAPADASAAASGSANPLVGSWTLVSASDSATCPDSIQFTADTYTSVWSGVTKTNHAIYRAYPGYMVVYAGGPVGGYFQFNLTSADVITNVTGNQYAMANCPYKRS